MAAVYYSDMLPYNYHVFRSTQTIYARYWSSM